ncbi:MAG: hypothetical protein OXN23_03825 [Gammaproteobacteria bacterium]|nr:hypothetical protein [Gammaproteobacteria bacterium]
MSVGGGTATAADYAAVSAFTLTIAEGAGSASGTFTLEPVDDDLDEDDETIGVSGSSGAGTVTGDEIEITDNDERGITVAGGPLTLAEADVGSTQDRREDRGTYTVVLSSRPTGTVTVTVASDPATGVVTVSPPRLTFAPSAWSTAQTVTVTAVDDAIDNPGNEREAEIEHTVSAPDTDYASETAAAVDVTVTDDDAAPSGITLTAAPDAVAEGAGPTAVAVTASVNGATRYATATAVTVSVDDDTAIAPADYAAVADFTLTIAAGAGSASGTFTLTPVDDALDESDETIDVTGSSGALTVTGDEIEITDDDARAPTQDTPEVSLMLTPTKIDESGSANVSTVTATLDGMSSAAVTVTISIPSDAPVTQSGTTLTIAAGTTSSTGTVTLTAVDDEVDAPDRTVTVSGTASGGGISNPADVTLTIVDDDVRGIVLTPAVVGVAEGSSATYTVKLATEPSASATVAISGHAGTDLTLDSTSLTFAPSAWSTAQTVTVTAVEDVDFTNETATLTHTASGGDYGSVTGAVTVNTTDNDTRPTAMTITVDTDSNQDGAQTSITENAGATTVRITAAIAGAGRFTTDQTVTLAVGHAGDGAVEGVDYATVPALSLTIAAGQASGSVDFTLTPTDDGTDEADEAIGVSGTLSGVTVSAATITLVDDDATPTVRLALTPSSISEGGGATGGTSAVTATLNRASSETVTLTVAAAAVSPATAGDYTLSANKILTIAAGSLTSTGTVKIVAVDNPVDAPDKQVTVSAAVSGGHGVAPPGPVALTIADDDDPPTALTLSVDTDVGSTAASSAVGEEGGAVTVRVTATLDGATRFSTDRTVTVTVGQAEDSAVEEIDYAAVADLSLTLPAGRASGSADFTLTPTDDDINEPDETISVIGTLSEVTVTPAAITVLDDDAPPVVSLLLTPSRIVENGGPADDTSTVTASLSNPSSTEIALTVSAEPVPPAASGDFTFSGGTLTIAAGSRTSTGTVSIVAVDDHLHSGDRRIAVSATASGNPGVANPAPATLILADDDAAPTLLNLSVDIDPEEAGLQNSLAEDSEAVTVRVVATLEGDIRFAEEKTVTVVVGMTGDSAIEGQDYETVADLSLTLPAGQASASVDFTLAPINDGVNETEEMIGIGGTLAGVSVTPAAIILHNSNDPVPKEWLARFGRTVSEQLLDGIAGRIDEIRKPGFESTLAGSVLSVAGPEGDDETPWDRRQDEAENNWAQGFKAAFGEDPGDLRREEGSATGRDLFDDGAFSYTSEEQGGAVTAFWGRIARSGFDGRGRDYAYDSEVTTGMLGLDWARIGTDENWSGGFVVSRSQGDGGYTGEVGLSGSAESTLTAFAPWLSYQGSDRLAVWGAAGYGEGDFTIAPEGEPAATADLDWAMAAAGVHYQLVRASPERAFALKLKTDALWTRTNMEEAMGLAEAQADVTRFRLGLENSWRIQQEDAGVLTPRFEVGVRHDGGDAETGFSVELGGGLTWVLPARGLDISLEGRSLVLHEDGFHNWGYAASMAFDPDPASARGFSLTLSQSLGGDPSGGVDALFAEGAPAQENASVGEGGWQAGLEYGLALGDGRFAGTPYLTYADGGNGREYVLGWQLAPMRRESSDFMVDLKAVRSESVETRPEHELGFDLRFSW